MADRMRRQRRGTKQRTDPFTPLREAEDRVGVTAFARAKWLVAFARRWEDESPDNAVPVLQWEALAFAKGLGKDKTLDYSMVGLEDLPDWPAVRKAELEAARWLRELRDAGHASLQASAWTGTLRMFHGEVEAGTDLVQVRFEAAFAIRVHAALAGLRAEPAHLRFCAYCREAFVSKRADKTTCSGACRTQAWRKPKKNREKLREYRRQVYRRAHPKSRIPRQRSHAKDGA